MKGPDILKRYLTESFENDNPCHLLASGFTFFPFLVSVPLWRTTVVCHYGVDAPLYIRLLHHPFKNELEQYSKKFLEHLFHIHPVGFNRGQCRFRPENNYWLMEYLYPRHNIHVIHHFYSFIDCLIWSYEIPL